MTEQQVQAAWMGLETYMAEHAVSWEQVAVLVAFAASTDLDWPPGPPGGWAGGAPPPAPADSLAAQLAAGNALASTWVPGWPPLAADRLVIMCTERSPNTVVLVGVLALTRKPCADDEHQWDFAIATILQDVDVLFCAECGAPEPMERRMRRALEHNGKQTLRLVDE